MVRRRGGLSRGPFLGRARIREGNLPRRRHGTGGRAGQHHRLQHPRREPAPEIEAVGSRVGGWINRRQPRPRRNRYGAGGALRVHGGGVGFHPELRHQIPPWPQHGNRRRMTPLALAPADARYPARLRNRRAEAR